MSRTRRFLGGVGLGYANQVLVTVAALWLTPFLLGRLGQEDYGLWLVSGQIMAYLMLADFGTVGLLPRETAYATGRAGGVGQATDLPDIIGRTIRLVLWQTLAVAAAVVVVWLSLPEAWGPLRQPLGIIMAAFVVLFPCRVFAAVLQGLQDLTFLAGAQIAAWLVGTAVTLGCVLGGFGLTSLALGWLVTQVLAAALSWYRLRTRFPGVLPRRLPRLSWETTRGQLSRGLWVSVSQVAQVLLAGSDLLIIGKVFGPAAVVPYACTGKLIGFLSNQPQILMQAASPALSELKATGSRESLRRVSTALTQAMLLGTGAVVCVVLAVNQGFVGWWVGAAQYGGIELNLLLLVNLLLRHWNTTAVYSIFCFGYERRISITTLLDGLVTVGGALGLVRVIGPCGVPVASIVGVCLVSLPGNLSALAREAGVSVLTLAASLFPWFWRLVVVAAAAGALAVSWVPENFLALAATTSLIALAYGLLMAPMVLRSPLGVYLHPRLARLRAWWAGTPRPEAVDVRVTE